MSRFKSPQLILFNFTVGLQSNQALILDFGWGLVRWGPDTGPPTALLYSFVRKSVCMERRINDQGTLAYDKAPGQGSSGIFKIHLCAEPHAGILHILSVEILAQGINLSLLKKASTWLTPLRGALRDVLYLKEIHEDLSVRKRAFSRRGVPNKKCGIK